MSDGAAYPARYTEFFGPSAWKLIHAVSFTYPDNPSVEERKQYTRFFRSLADVLPCPGCRVHYADYLKEHPIRAANRGELSLYFIELHNEVNRRLGKKVVPVEQVVDMYTGWNMDKQAELVKLSKDEQARRLGDPHFGNYGGDRAGGKSARERSQGVGFFTTTTSRSEDGSTGSGGGASNVESALKIGVPVVLAVALGVLIYRRVRKPRSSLSSSQDPNGSTTSAV